MARKQNPACGDLEKWLRRNGPTPPGAELPLIVGRGEGTQVWTATGEKLLDFSCGALMPLGHRGPAVLEKLSLCLGPEQESPDRIVLMCKLAELVPGGTNRRVLLCDSGREALARATGLARKSTGRGRVVYLADLEGPEPDFGDDVAAVVVHPLDARLAAAAAFCKESGALLVDDESGIAPGVCGRVFAIELAGLRPDVYVLGRGVAAGFPLGACVTGSSTLRWECAPQAGSPAGSRMAVEYLQALEEGLLNRAVVRGAALRAGLAAAAGADRILGAGLYLGLRFERAGRAAGFRAGCRERGLLLAPVADTVVGVWPPLVVSDAEVGQACGVVAEVLAGQAE